MRLQGLKDIKKSRLSSKVAGQLRRAIREGRFLPGERLGSERHLSQELGVSRPVLREALHMLEFQSLVTIRHGHGTFVTDTSTELLDVDPLQWLTENRMLVHGFYEARSIIEPECAALASQRASPEQIIELQKIMARAHRVLETDEVVAFIGLDIDFHTMVAKMAGNPFLFQMLSAIINPNTDIRKVLHRLSGHPSVAHNRHLLVVSAIEKRDPEGARKEMIMALRGASQDVQWLLAKEVVR